MPRGPRPAKPKEAKPPIARKSPKNGDASGHDLEKRLAEALRDKAEAQEQQAATAEILRVISRSQTDLQPVFDTIAQSAVRLCGGVQGNVVRFDGELVHRVAGFNLDPEGEEAFRDYFPRALGRELAITRSIQDGSVVHVPDTLQDTDPIHELAQATRARALLAVPMLRDGQPIGAISVARREARPFSDSQIALLQIFADQAVIAIENVRLFTELEEKNHALTKAHATVTEALDQRTATAEILKVISLSPTDMQPVFDKIALNAVRVCDAAFCALFREEGGLVHMVAHYNFTPEGLAELQRLFPMSLDAPQTAARLIASGEALHVADVLTDQRIPLGRQRRVAEIQGYRGYLGIPMLREGKAIGALAVARREVGLFSESQVELLKTFADQAVIAIENVRLFTETKEALDRQTATSEILGVISRSPTDYQPVFDTIVRNAAEVCAAHDAVLALVDGEDLIIHAQHGPIGAPIGVRYPMRDTASGLAVRERRPVHVENLAEAVEFPAGRDMARRGGHRTTLCVPLLREGLAMGTIMARRAEVRPFTDAQIALLETFAAQAVIAIENVRLFKELQEKNQALTQAHAQVTESLEQQTATSEILRVIASSPTDVQPVFDTIVRTGARLCEANYGFLARYDGTSMAIVAHAGATDAEMEAVLRVYPMVPTTNSLGGRTILERAVVHIPDVRSDPTCGMRVIQDAGWRTGLGVPLLREGAAIGLLGMWRRDVRPFSDRQIALLETFADQAVIAIENVRLFNETKEALDRQTATSEILGVISSSPTDLQPVFDTIVRNAVRLCGAVYGTVSRSDGVSIQSVAHCNLTPEQIERVQRTFPRSLSDRGATATAIRTGTVVCVADLDAEPDVSQPR